MNLNEILLRFFFSEMVDNCLIGHGKTSEYSFQQKHPHVIFEARTKANKGCANTEALERRMGIRRQKHIAGYHGDLVDIIEQQHPNGAGRYKRDVREATKYIETAIVVDKAMFEKRNGSTRAEVVHDAIQVANIADLVSTQNTLHFISEYFT